MMIEPPIDKLAQKTDCLYALVSGITKRTKEVLGMEHDALNTSGLKAISFAAKEIYDGKFKITL